MIPFLELKEKFDSGRVFEAKFSDSSLNYHSWYEVHSHKALRQSSILRCIRTVERCLLYQKPPIY